MKSRRVFSGSQSLAAMAAVAVLIAMFALPVSQAEVVPGTGAAAPTTTFVSSLTQFKAMTWTPTATVTTTATITTTETVTGTVTPVETLPPSPTPTSTATSTPAPARIPLVMLQRQHLQNGGFESGAFAPGWSDSGELARMVSDTHPYIGDHAALLGDPGYDTNGGCPFGRATIQQTFDVPREGHPMLQVWFRLYSYDTKDFDYFAIDIAPWPVGPAERVFRYGSPYWLNGNLWNSGWIPATIPLDDYVGKRITIRLYNAMTNDDGYYNTWTYVDEVVVVP